jgi:hypothetical protein
LSILSLRPKPEIRDEVTKILKSLLLDLNDRLHALDVMENDL